MVTIIHGGDSLSSYNALKKIINNFDELSVTRLVGKDTNIHEIREALETPSFTGSRMVIIEDLSSNKNQDLVKELKNYLLGLTIGVDLIIYERRILPPESPVLSLTDKIQVYTGARGLNVFEWADHVGSRKLVPALSGWQKHIESGDDPEYLFSMIIRQFRLLNLLKRGADPKIPPFVKQKMLAQTRLWEAWELPLIYKKLLEIDYQVKTGVTNLQIAVTNLFIDIAKTT